MPLEREEQKHVTAAEGFLEFGLPLDADAELDRVDPSAGTCPKSWRCEEGYTALSRNGSFWRLWRSDCGTAPKNRIGQ